MHLIRLIFHITTDIGYQPDIRPSRRRIRLIQADTWPLDVFAGSGPMMTFPQTLPLVKMFCSQLSPSIEVVSAAESGLGAHFGERGEREITWIFRVFSFLGSLQPRMNGS
jgi:hypothetical protein